MNVTICNNEATMTISTLGAEPQSLVMDGREYLWNGDRQYWFRRAPLLFPMIGPTLDDKIWHAGKEYAMPNNGFARDMEFALESREADKAVFVLEDTEETRRNNYPFGFVLRVTYTMVGAGYRARAEITAKDDLWYTFGWHPAFSLDINGKGTELETYTLNFEQEERLTRKYCVNGAFVFEKDFVVGDTLDLSRAETDKGPITLDDVRSEEITLTSSSGEHGVTATMGDMTTFTAWTCLGKKAQYICLEPMVSFGDTKREKEISKMKETKFLRKGESVSYENEFRIF